MIYVILNGLLLAFFVSFAHFCDRKIKLENFEVGSFAISLLFACIESGLLFITLIFRNIWVASFVTQVMRLVFIFDAIFFITLSLSLLSIGENKKHKFWLNFTRIVLILFAFYLVYFHFRDITVEKGKGIIIESEYLFINPARKYFPWTWVTIFTALYRYFLPCCSYIILLIMQEEKTNQLGKYQSLILGLGILVMWICSYTIKVVSHVNPDFTFIFMFSYLFMVSIFFTAWTTLSVPSGRGVLVSILKVSSCYILPAVLIGLVGYFAQPVNNNFAPVFVGIFSVVSVAAVVYSIFINDKLGSSSKLYTADYAVALEKDLASIEYADAEMDVITNQMYEILRRNIETSSFNVYILSGNNEVSTAYSSNKMSKKININTPMFDTLLNVNRSVVVYSQYTKEHDLEDVAPAIQSFFEETKSDVLFVLNEGHNILGLITLGAKISGDHYKEYDFNVFEKLYSYFFVFGYFMRNIANKDVLSVVNRELRMSSQIITSIQENIDKIENDKVDIGLLMVAARNIGGEFIDLIRLTDTRHLLVIGDLSGQGIAGSMSMVILKSIIRTYLAETHDFKELVVKINSFVRDDLRKGTIFAGLFALLDFETDTMYYINCGVPALFMYTQVYNNVIEIQGTGHILGFVKDLSPYISVKTTKFSPGDIILTCTDGLIQSHSLRGEIFGKERVQQAILDNSTYPAQRMAQFTFDELRKFMSKEMEDDVSIFVLKYGKPEVAAPEEEAAPEVVEAEAPVQEEAPVEESVIDAPVGNEISEDGTVVENPKEDEFDIDDFEERAGTFEEPAAESVEEKPADIPSPEAAFEMPVTEDINVEEAVQTEAVPAEPVVEAVEEPEPAAEPEPEPKVELHHDPAPEGFDMSELSDLDDLLKDAGL